MKTIKVCLGTLVLVIASSGCNPGACAQCYEDYDCVEDRSIAGRLCAEALDKCLDNCDAPRATMEKDGKAEDQSQQPSGIGGSS